MSTAVNSVLNYSFLLSSDRSGSNLCLRLIDAHPEMCAPFPSQLFPLLTRVLDRYGDLTQRENWRCLVADAVKLHHASFGCWENYPDTDSLCKAASPASLGAILRHIHSEEARAQGKQRLFVKVPQAYEYSGFLRSEFPAARYVYLVRDPRDMALSWKYTAGLRGGAMRAANIWQKDQQALLGLVQQLAVGQWVLTVTYEGLISNPAQELQRICGFLEILYSPAMLEFYQKPTTKRNAEMITAWRQLGSPLDCSNSGKYNDGLSKAELRYVEAKCGPEMAILGYQAETDAKTQDTAALAAHLKPLERWEKHEYRQLPLAERQAHTRLRDVCQSIEQSSRPRPFQTPPNDEV